MLEQKIIKPLWKIANELEKSNALSKENQESLKGLEALINKCNYIINTYDNLDGRLQEIERLGNVIKSLPEYAEFIKRYNANGYYD